MEPTLPAARIAGTLVVRSAFEQLKLDLARRNPPDVTALAASPVDPQLEAALDLLAGDGSSLWSDVRNFVQAKIVGRAAVFDEDLAREWLRQPVVRQECKAAAITLLTGQVPSPELSTKAFADLGGEQWWGAVLFEHTVAFLTKTLIAPLKTNNNVMLAHANARFDAVETATAHGHARIEGKLDSIERQLANIEPSTTSFGGQPVEVIDRYIRDEVRTERRRMSIGSSGADDALAKLATRALNGDLAGGSQDTRILAMRNAAIALARAERADEAEEWVRRAKAFGAEGLELEEARLHLVRGEFDPAFKLLRDRPGPIAQ